MDREQKQELSRILSPNEKCNVRKSVNDKRKIEHPKCTCDSLEIFATLVPCLMEVKWS